MSDFTHLHVYTDYSILDSCIQSDALISKCKETGHKSIAITNRGNLSNILEIIQDAAKENIKVIPGIDLVVPHNHSHLIKDIPPEREEKYNLILLAINHSGYQNLLKISTEASLDGFKDTARLDFNTLNKYNEGLICLSGGPHSYLTTEMIRYSANTEEMLKETSKLINKYKEVFKDRYYIQLHFQSREGYYNQIKRVNDSLIEIAKHTNTPYVGVGSCRYLEKEDFDAFRAVYLINHGRSNKVKSINNSYWFQNKEELLDLFPIEALDESKRISDRCEPIQIEREFKFPYIKTKIPLDDLLQHEVDKGLEIKFQEHGILEKDKQVYRDRAILELKVLKEMGFSSYILVVADYVNWAKSEGIYVGEGRGSAAGSLVCWLTGITDVNPIKYGLLFERFINPQRISLPDIDLDFEDGRRDEVKAYLAKKYGQEHTASITTFGTMAAKGCIRDISRAEGVPLEEADLLARAVPASIRGKNVYLDDCLNDKYFNKLINENEKYKYIFNICKKVEKQIRNTGTHAAGIVISDKKPLVEYTPLYKDDDGNIVTQYSMGLIENIGLIKFDLLALSTLTTLKNTVNLVYKHRKELINLSKIPLDDKAVYDLLCSGNLVGIFQLGGSSGFKEITIQIQPRSIQEISDITSLYRPGPLDNNFHKTYIKNKHSGEYLPQIIIKGKEEVLDKILKPTKGVLIYQEQIMELSKQIAGFSLAQADLLRRAMGKKDPIKMAAEKKGFVQGCIKNDVSESEAADLFDMLAKFAEYGFNASHSIAYSLITYKTAWLKTHYPNEFLTACLTEEIGVQDSTLAILSNCKQQGIKLLKPDINKSDYSFTSESEGIRFGLGSIKDLGEAAANQIMLTRQREKMFYNLPDFCGKVNLQSINKKRLEVLIKAGAFDNIL